MVSDNQRREALAGLLRVLVDGPEDPLDGLCINVSYLLDTRAARGDQELFPVPAPSGMRMSNGDTGRSGGRRRACTFLPLYEGQYGQNRFRWGVDQVHLLMDELGWPEDVDLLPLRLRALQVLGPTQGTAGICHNVVRPWRMPASLIPKPEYVYGSRLAGRLHALLHTLRPECVHSDWELYPVRLPGEDNEDAERRYADASAREMWGEGEYANRRWQLVQHLLIAMGKDPDGVWHGTHELVRGGLINYSEF